MHTHVGLIYIAPCDETNEAFLMFAPRLTRVSSRAPRDVCRSSRAGEQRTAAMMRKQTVSSPLLDVIATHKQQQVLRCSVDEVRSRKLTSRSAPGMLHTRTHTRTPRPSSGLKQLTGGPARSQVCLQDASGGFSLALQRVWWLPKFSRAKRLFLNRRFMGCNRDLRQHVSRPSTASACLPFQQG